ncbi:MAG: hypothetical protein B7Z66_00615 [Chromatiales bacterium 21-64-14]|nr:MAG: hypothetical protein B7Z66_00615 [Chromatiales bacterium 21-64-14]HQU15533.1 FimV/HubP family polar landmark protein [Gammaproteobacteria bacterium]
MNRKLAVAVASVCMLAPMPLYALGLGDITLHSHLDEKLTADIQLYSDNPAELEGALVSLASPGVFSRAGIDRPFVLSELHFKVLRDAKGQPYIQVTSDQPIREPFLDFIVEVDWRKGRILRQYTVLLNPPTLTSARPTGVQPAAAVPAGPVTAPVPKPAAPAAGAMTMAPPPGRQRAVERGHTAAPTSAAAPGTLRTVRNDTLWAIAQRIRAGDDSVTVEQMMLALLNANPDAFYDHNINRLKAGYVLRIPDVSAALGIDRHGALAQVRRQTQLWEAYRRRLAESASGAAPVATRAAPAPTPAAVPKEQDRLRLLAPSSAAGGASAAGVPGTAGTPTRAALKHLQNQLALATESAAVGNQQSKELQGRVTALQGQVDQLKRLLSLKDQQLADLQNRIQPAQGPQAAVPAAPVVETPNKAQATGGTEPSVKPGAAAVEKPAAPAVTSPARRSTPLPPKMRPVSPAPVPAKAPPTGGLRALLNDRGLLAMVGGVALALLALVWLVLRRRNRPASFPLDEPGFPAPADDMDDSVAGRVPEAPGPEAESAVAEAGGDPMAEAEIYIAYGRYAQAAEQLSRALEADPDRSDLKAKLLEVYHASGDREAFESGAESLYADLGGSHHPLWEKVAALGAELCPDHPLFRGDEPDDGSLSTGPETGASGAELGERRAPTEGEELDRLLDEMDSTESAADGAAGHPAARAPAFQEESDTHFVVPEIRTDEPGLAAEPAKHDTAPSQETAAEADDPGFVFPAGFPETTEDAPSNVIEWDGDLADSGAQSAEDADSGAEDAALGEPDEVGTKLDLARAYLDMGDQEGARELLEEVLEEGSDPQREEAHGLMAQLSA